MTAPNTYRGDSCFPTEEAFVSHFIHFVEPLRRKLLLTQLGELPVNEIDRALFVFRFGMDRFAYYRKRLAMTAYDRQQLDEYVLRQFR